MLLVIILVHIIIGQYIGPYYYWSLYWSILLLVICRMESSSMTLAARTPSPPFVKHKLSIEILCFQFMLSIESLCPPFAKHKLSIQLFIPLHLSYTYLSVPMKWKSTRLVQTNFSATSKIIESELLP